MKITITLEELSDIIDSSFDLGKTYATDEISTMSNVHSVDIPVFITGSRKFQDFIEKNDGQTYSAREAKKGIAWKCVGASLKKALNSEINFD